MANPFDQFDASNNPFDQFDEVEKPKKKAGIGTALKSSFAGLGNVADLTGTSIAAGGAFLFGDDKEGLRLMDEMEARRKSRDQWANPEGLELTGAGKLAGAALTLPAQVLTAPLSAAETAYQAKKSGESNSAARKAAMTDAAANALGLAIPGFMQGGALVRGATGFVTNAAQDYASKAAIQSMLKTEGGKAKFEPTLEDAAISGVIGGGFGLAAGKAARKPTGNKKLDAIREADAKKPQAPEVDVGARVFEELINQQRTGEKSAVSFPPEGDAGAWTAKQLQQKPTMPPEAVANEGLDGQLPLFETAMEGRGISPYEAVPGDWRIDENGMPIKADLSMDAQNMQNPLQRHLWGDELATPDFGRDPNAPLPMDRNIMGYEQLGEKVVNRTDPEAAIPLTEAIDSMGWAQKRGALKKTKMGRELPADGPMEAAKMQAESLPLGSKARKEAFIAAKRKTQGGAIQPDVFLKDFPEFVGSKMKDATGQLKRFYHGTSKDCGGA